MLELQVPRNKFSPYLMAAVDRERAQVWRWLKGKSTPPSYVFKILEMQVKMMKLQGQIDAIL